MSDLLTALTTIKNHCECYPTSCSACEFIDIGSDSCLLSRSPDEWGEAIEKVKEEK